MSRNSSSGARKPGKGIKFRPFAVLFLFFAAFRAGAQTELAFSGGLSYSLCLEQAERSDIHSFDFIFDAAAAYTLKTVEFSRASARISLFAGAALLQRNSLLPEASNYIIYDTAFRAALLTGPRIGFFLGKHFEPYLGAGLALLGILVDHRETTAFRGDVRYERFEVNTGAGLTAGIKWVARRDRPAAFFLNFGAFFGWYFINYTKVTSTYDTFAGFAGHFYLFEIRPFLTAGLTLRKEKKT